MGDIVFVTDVQFERGRNMSHEDARTYGDAFAGIGIDIRDVDIIAPCRPVDRATYDSTRAMNAVLKEDRARFIERIKEFAPKLIITAGSTAARQVFGRAVKITELRGVPSVCKDFPDAVILPLYSGAHIRRVPEYAHTLSTDFMTVQRLIDSNFDIAESTAIRGVDYQWIDDVQFIIDAKPELLSLDTEYTGGSWVTGKTRLLTIQFSFEEGKAYVLPIDYPFMPYTRLAKKRVVSQLRELLTNPEIGIVGHNVKGDVHVIREALGIEIANIAHDTLVLVHDVNENMVRKSLDECIRYYVPALAGYSDVYDNDPVHQGKSRMDLFPPEKMLWYGGGDADACLRLFHVLIKILSKDRAALNCYTNVRMRAYRVFVEIERNGFYVDVGKLDRFKEELTAHQAAEQEYLLSRIPESILCRYRNTGVGIKISRPEILRDFLFTHPQGLRLRPIVFTASDPTKPSVSGKAHLPYFADNPYVSRLMEYLKNEKMLTTYVNGYYKYINNGRVRPSYFLHVTDTGRTASKDPNGQNTPKRGKFAQSFNRIFVAPKGWVIIDADFSQVELRVVADEANESRMIRVYADEGDIHESTAAGVMDMSVEEFRKLDKATYKLKRNQAKPVNFGFLYGMWWKKFKVFAKTDYGMDFTDKQAETLRTKFFTTYPGLARWHEAATAFIKKNGYIRSKCGKVRHLPDVFSKDEAAVKQALRQGINAPIQCFGNTLGLVALHYLSKEMPKDKFMLCGYVHDDIIAYIREDYLIEGADKFKYIMEHLPIKQLFGTKLRVPIRAEVAFGRNKADMYEYKDYYDVIHAAGAKTAPEVFAAIEEYQANKRLEQEAVIDTSLQNSLRRLRFRVRKVTPTGLA